MSISFVTATNAARGAFGGVTTSSIDTTTSDFLVMGMVCTDGYSTTPTDSEGNTWTEATSYTQTNVRVRLWYTVPTSTNAAHTFSASGSIVGYILVGAFSGVVQTSPADQQSGSNGFVSTLKPGSITPTEDNELVWSHFGINATGVPTSIDDSFTQITEGDFVSGESYGGSWAYKIQTSAAASDPTWTRTNTNGTAATQISFKAAAGVSTSLKDPILSGGGVVPFAR